MAAAAPEPAAAPPAAARPRPRAARRAAVPRAAGRARAGPRPGHRHVGQHGRDGRRRRTGWPPRKAAAIDALKDLPAGGKVSVIAAGPDGPDRRQRDDRPRPRPAGDRRRSRPTSAAATSATRSSSPRQLAARSGDAEILVATDARARDAAPTAHGRRRRSRSCRVGPRRGTNQAIVALAVRTAPSAVTRSVFVSVANLDLEPADAPARGLGRRPPARGARPDRSTPQARADVVIDDVPADVGTSRSASSAATRPSDRAPDQLAVDDRAWAVVPPQRTATDPRRRRRATRTSRRRCRYLPEQSSCSASRRTSTRPAPTGTDGTAWDLVIFEGDAAGDAAARRRSSPSRRRSIERRSARSTGHAEEPGHRVARPGRADPALRRPVDDPHRGGRRSSTLPGLGADGHPGAEGRAAPLRRAPGPACRPPSSPSSRASPTCRSRSRSRSCSRT